MLDSDTWPRVGLKYIGGIPPGSKVRYPDLVVSTFQVTRVVTHSGSSSMFLSPPSGTCPISLSQSTISMSVYFLLPTLPGNSWCSWNFHDYKGDNKL